MFPSNVVGCTPLLTWETPLEQCVNWLFGLILTLCYRYIGLHRAIDTVRLAWAVRQMRFISRGQCGKMGLFTHETASIGPVADMTHGCRPTADSAWIAYLGRSVDRVDRRPRDPQRVTLIPTVLLPIQIRSTRSTTEEYQELKTVNRRSTTVYTVNSQNEVRRSRSGGG